MSSAAAAVVAFLLLLLAAPLIPSAAAAVNPAPPQGRKPSPNQSPPRTAAAPPPSLAVDLGMSTSAVFPLAGNVYPDGMYYVAMSIGNPPKPYFLDVDTGSDLTWVQCDAPCVRCFKGPHPLYRPNKNQLVPCRDPICTALQASASPPPTAVAGRHCERSPNQCDYQVHYADAGSSLGVLVTDRVSLRVINGSVITPTLAFGCGYDQQGVATSPVDGVLGLGLGKAGIVSQLRDKGLVRSVIGHCLSSRGGGFLFLGDTLVPRSGLVWTPMHNRGPAKHYSPEPGTLFFGKHPLVSNFQVVFDSGSSYTYFANRTYQVFLDALMKDLHGKPLKMAPEDRTLPICWKGHRAFKSVADFKRYFTTLVVSFGSGRRTLLEIPPEGYLIITKHGNACLGILNGSEAQVGDFNLIGDISLQDYLFVYDNERNQIGWARANCDRKVNTEGDGGFEGGFYQPEYIEMGILSEQCPASHYT